MTDVTGYAVRRMQDSHLLTLAALKLTKAPDPPVAVSALAELTMAMNASIVMPPTTDIIEGPSLVRENYWPPAYRLCTEPRSSDEYWSEWARFCALWFGLRRQDGFNTCHHATWCIHQAIARSEPALLPEQRCDLVRRFWTDRWLLINFDAALLLSVYEEQGGIAQDSGRLAALRVETAERLRALKMDCRTLGDWFEGLHGVSPLIMQGYRVALAANDDSSHRWFDEMQADIAGVLHDPLSRALLVFL